MSAPNAVADAWTTDTPGVDTVKAVANKTPGNSGTFGGTVVVANNQTGTASTVDFSGTTVMNNTLYGIDGYNYGNTASIPTPTPQANAWTGGTTNTPLAPVTLFATHATGGASDQSTMAMDGGGGAGTYTNPDGTKTQRPTGFYTWYWGNQTGNDGCAANTQPIFYWQTGASSPTTTYCVPYARYFGSTIPNYYSSGGAVNQVNGMLYLGSGECNTMNNSTNAAGVITGMSARFSVFDPATNKTYWSGLAQPATPSDNLWPGGGNGNTTCGGTGYIASGMALDAQGDMVILVNGTGVAIPASSPINDTGVNIPAGSQYVSFLVKIVPSFSNSNWTFSIMKMIWNGNPSNVLSTPKNWPTNFNNVHHYGTAFLNGQLYVSSDSYISVINPLTGVQSYLGQARPQAPAPQDGNFYDLGSTQTAMAITGTVYNDAAASGVYNSGDAPVPGVLMALYETGGTNNYSQPTLIGTQTTDFSGHYTFLVSDLSSTNDAKYYVRPVQPSIASPAGNLVAADVTAGAVASNTMLGAENPAVLYCPASATNNTAVAAATGDGAGTTMSSTCMNYSGLSPAVEAIGATSDPATWGGIYGTAVMNNTFTIPRIDFAITTASTSFGDASTGPATTALGAPVHNNSTSATVWLGSQLGNYTDPATDNTSHNATDDGVYIPGVAGNIPLTGTVLAATKSYTLKATLSGPQAAEAAVSGWTTSILSSPTATNGTWTTAALGSAGTWSPTVATDGSSASGSFQYQASGTVGATAQPIQMRVNASPASMAPASATNATSQYQGGNPQWTTTGEIEDYSLSVADAVYRPAAQTTSGTTAPGATVTINSTAILNPAGLSTTTTYGQAVGVGIGQQTFTASLSGDSAYALQSLTVENTDGTGTPTVCTPAEVTASQCTYTFAIGDDITVLAKLAPEPSLDKSWFTVVAPATATEGNDNTLKAYIADANGNVIEGALVTFAIAPAGPTFDGPDAAQCTTGADGTCTVPVTSTTAGTYTASATVAGVTGPVPNVPTGTDTATWTTGTVSGANSSFSCAPTSTAPVVANGTDSYTCTVVVKDDGGNAITGLASSDFEFLVVAGSPAAATSNVATGSVAESAATPGTYTVALTSVVADPSYAVSAVVDSVPISGTPAGSSQNLAVPFVAGPPAPPGPITCPDGETVTNGTVLTSAPSATVGGDIALSAYVLDANCNPIPGAAVSLTNGTPAGDATVTPATPIATDPATGLAAGGNVTDQRAETVGVAGSYTWPDNPAGATTPVALVPASVEFTADAPALCDTAHPCTCAAGLTESTNISANPADQVPVTTGSSTIRGYVTDKYCNPLSGVPVSFAVETPSGGTFGTPGSTAVTTAQGTTNDNGIFTATLMDSTAETVNVDGTFDTTNTAFEQSPVAVGFIAGGLDPQKSSFSCAPAGPVTANGSDAYTCTILAKDSSSNPLGGLSGFTMNINNSGPVYTPVAETSTSGTYTTTITSLVADPAGTPSTVSAYYGTATMIASQADVPIPFTAGPVAPGVVCPASGTPQHTSGQVIATPASTGINTSSDLSVYLFDANCNPVPGVTVAFQDKSTTPGTTVGFTMTGTPAGQTNDAGLATGTVTDSAPEAVTVGGTYASTDNGSGDLLTTAVTFTDSHVSGTNSDFSVSPAGPVAADGTSAYTGMIAVKDGSNRPVAGLTISDFTFPVTSTTDPAAATDVKVAGFAESTTTPGTYTVQFTSTVADANYLVSAVVDTVPVAAQANVPIPFAAGPVTPGIVCPASGTPQHTSGQVIATPASTGINTSSDLSVYLYDANCNPVVGSTVTFTDTAATPSATATIDNTVQPTTDSTGLAKATIADSAPETITVGGTYSPTTNTGADNGQLLTTPVRFTDSHVSGTYSVFSVDVSPSSSTPPVADGSQSYTGTILVFDGSDRAVTGLTDSDFKFDFAPSGAAVTASTVVESPTTPGTYIVHFTSLVASPDYAVSAEVDSVPVTGTPAGSSQNLPIPFQAGPVDPGQVCPATGSPQYTSGQVMADASPLTVGGKSNLSVYLFDANCNPVAGATVAFADAGSPASAGAVFDNTVQATTDSTGLAKGTVTDDTAETVTVGGTFTSTGNGDGDLLTKDVVFQAGLLDPSKSVFVVSPKSGDSAYPVTADGSSAYTGTVTARDSQGNLLTSLDPLAFAYTIAGAPSGGSVAVTGQSSDGQGHYSVKFASTFAASAYTVQAFYGTTQIVGSNATDGTTITPATPIPFQAGSVAINQTCTGGRLPTSITIDSASQAAGTPANATVYAADANCNPVPDASVIFTPTGQAFMTPASGVGTTGSSGASLGYATMPVNDYTAQPVQVTALVGGYTLGPVNTTFTPGDPVPGPVTCPAGSVNTVGTNLSVSPSLVQLSGSAAGTANVTAYVTDQFCNAVTKPTAIAFAVTSPSGTASIPSPLTVDTDSTGYAKTTVSDATPEVASVTAKLGNSPVNPASGVQVTFQTGSVSGPDSSFTCVVTAMSSVPPVADGTQSYTCTATMDDANHVPLKTLNTAGFAFDVTGGVDNTKVVNQGVTNVGDGTYIVQFTTTTADANYQVAASYASLAITGAPTVNPSTPIPFQAGAPVPPNPLNPVCPDGRPLTNTGTSASQTTQTAGRPVAVTTLVTDVNCNPVSGATVDWTVSSASSAATASPMTLTTGASGTVTTTLNDKVAELANVSATATKNNTSTDAGSTSVLFTAGAPVPGPVVCPVAGMTGSGLTATTPVQMGGTSDVTAKVTDEDCNPVSGVTVTFGVTSPSTGASITTTPGSVTYETDGTGIAKATATDPTAETAQVSATIDNGSGTQVPLDGSPAPVLFQAGTFNGLNSTFTVLPQVSTSDSSNWPVADGRASYTGTITALDGNGNPLAGLTGFTFSFASQYIACSTSGVGSPCTVAEVDPINQPGVYAVKFTTTRADSGYTVSAAYNGIPITGQTSLTPAQPASAPIPFRAGAPIPPDTQNPTCPDGRNKTNTIAAPTTTGVGPMSPTSGSLIQALVTDANCNPVPGAAVGFTTTGTAKAAPTATGSFTTNAQGIATADLTDTVAEQSTVTATATVSGGTTAAGAKTVTFTAGSPSAGPVTCPAGSPNTTGTNLTATSPVQMPGTSTATALITDEYCNVITTGVPVTFGVTSPSTKAALTAAAVQTSDPNGVAKVTLTDPTAETAQVTATILVSGVPKPIYAPASAVTPQTSAPVVFTAGPVVPGTVCTVMIGGVPTSVTSGQVMADPASVAINGSSALSVYLFDADCNPVPGATVTYQDKTASATGAVLSPAATTNSAGLATGTVTDANPAVVTIGGTYSSANNGSGDLLTTPVTFIDSSVSTTLSSFSVSPAGPVTADGKAAYTGTVTVKDGSDEPVTNLTAGDFTFPVMAGSPAAATTYVAATSAVETTATSGIYTVAFTSTVADPSYTVSAQINGATVQSQQNVAIPFVAGAPTPGPIPGCTNPDRPGTGISVDVTPQTAGQTSTVTQLVTDENCNPIDGATVAFTSTHQTPSGSAVVTTVVGTTGSDGIATATIKDTTAQTDTVTANWKTTAPNPVGTGSDSIDVTFQADQIVPGTVCTAMINGQPTPVASGQVIAMPASVLINGSSALSVYLFDANCNPVQGATVTFQDKSVTPSTTVGIVMTGAPIGITNADGLATGSLTDSAPETVTEGGTYSSPANGSGDLLTTPVTFKDSAFSAVHSTFQVNPAGPVTADGKTAYTGTITLKDGSNDPMTGEPAGDFTFTLLANGSATTDVAVTFVGESTTVPGTYSVTFTSKVADPTYTVTANYLGEGIVTQSAVPIPFTAGAPTPGPIPGCTNPDRPGTGISVDVTPQTAGQTSTVTQLVTDENCNPIDGATVAFTSTHQTPSGSAVVTTVVGTTGSDGIATATIKDTTAQTDTVTANWSTVAPNPVGTGSDFIDVTFQAGSVKDGPFDCGPLPGTNLSADKTTTAVNTSVIANAYVTDEYCNPIPDHAVTFTVDGSAHFTSPATPPIVVNTNANGHAFATLTDSVAETANVTATGSSIGTVAVTFTAGLIDPSLSTFTVTPAVSASDPAKAGWATADGTSAYTGYVAAKDGNGNPVPGLTVTDFTFVPSSGAVKMSSVTELAATPGTYQVKFTSTDADSTVNVYATYQGTTIGQSVANLDGTVLPIPFKAGAAVINPTGPGCTTPVVRDGTNFSVDKTAQALGDPATGNAYVTDNNCNPVEGALVTFSSDQTGAPVTPATLATGVDGHAVATITSATPLTANFGASISAGTLPKSPVAVTWVPAAPALTGPSGPVVTDKPKISGSGSEPGDSITVTDADGNTVCQTTVQPDLKWSCTPSSPLPGQSVLTAAETDPKGNVSAPSAPLGVSVNTAPPAITGPKAGSTVVTSTPVIQGTAPNGSTVTVKDSLTGNPVPGCENLTVVGGAWSCTPSAPGLTNDAHQLMPTVSDGNGGANDGAAVPVTVDTTKPTLDSPAADSTSATATPPMSGSAPAGTTVSVIDSKTGDPVPGCKDVAVDSTGKWTCTPTSPLAADDHTLTPVVSDGNGGTNTGTPVPVSVNTTPAAITGPKPGSTVTVDTPPISGTGNTPGDQITVNDKNGNPVCTATVGVTGQWSCTPANPLPSGQNQLTVTETDKNHNAGPQSAPITVDVNTTPPVISGPASGSTLASDTPKISGQGNTPGDTVTVKDSNGDTVCAATVQADKSWSCTPYPPLGPDGHSLTATETDQNGNTGKASAPIDVTVKATPPTVSVPPAGSTVVTDKPVIGGTGNTPGDSVTVVDGNGNPVCTATVGPDGKWSCTPDTPLPPGASQLKAAETDQSGNTGKWSALVDVNVDTAPPAITGPSDGALTNNPTPTISGTGTVPGDTVTVKDSNGDTVCTTTVGSDGKWSCTPAAPGLSSTDHSLTATETDAGGNAGTPSAPVKLTVDTSKPSQPAVDPTNGSQVTGTGTPGDKITVKDGSGNVVPGCESTVVDSTGQFKCVPTTPVKPGNSLTVTATNPAGTPSDPVSVTVAGLQIAILHPSRTVGQPQTITCSAFNRGEQVDLTLASTPIDMGAVAADKTGTAVFNITVPQGLAVGQHTATCVGPQSGVISGTFDIVGPAVGTGGSVVANPAGLAAGAGVLGLTGLWFAIAAFRRRDEDAE